MQYDEFAARIGSRAKCYACTITHTGETVAQILDTCLSEGWRMRGFTRLNTILELPIAPHKNTVRENDVEVCPQIQNPKSVHFIENPHKTGPDDAAFLDDILCLALLAMRATLVCSHCSKSNVWKMDGNRAGRQAL